jgi:hypothetical protein
MVHYNKVRTISSYPITSGCIHQICTIAFISKITASEFMQKVTTILDVSAVIHFSWFNVFLYYKSSGIISTRRIRIRPLILFYLWVISEFCSILKFLTMFSTKNTKNNLFWLGMEVHASNPALQSLKQDHSFEVCLGYITKPYHKTKYNYTTHENKH